MEFNSNTSAAYNHLGSQQTKTFELVSSLEARNTIQTVFSSKIVGQEAAKRKLGRAAMNAFNNELHLCRDVSWLLTGPSSVGKTTMARVFAELVDLPFFEISPKSISTLEDIFAYVESELSKEGIELTQQVSPDNYVFPPCIIFIDEVHALKEAVQHGLLKAVESKDCILQTENGKTIDTYCVCWVIATTDSGDLFDAFDNRFCELNLKPYTIAEIAKIVAMYVEGELESKWNESIYHRIAKCSSRIPRKALELAREVSMEVSILGLNDEPMGWKCRETSEKIEKVVINIAKENGYDEFGMHERHLKILNMLLDGPIAKDRMALNCNVKIRELERRVMPTLLVETADQSSLVGVCKAGYFITDAGREELTKRDGYLNDYMVKSKMEKKRKNLDKVIAELSELKRNKKAFSSAFNRYNNDEKRLILQRIDETVIQIRKQMEENKDDRVLYVSKKRVYESWNMFYTVAKECYQVVTAKDAKTPKKRSK